METQKGKKLPKSKQYDTQYPITIPLHAFYIPRTWHAKVIIAVATMMLTMLVTTAEVVAYPTAEALRPH